MHCMLKSYPHVIAKYLNGDYKMKKVKYSFLAMLVASSFLGYSMSFSGAAQACSGASCSDGIKDSGPRKPKDCLNSNPYLC